MTPARNHSHPHRWRALPLALLLAASLTAALAPAATATPPTAAQARSAPLLWVHGWEFTGHTEVGQYFQDMPGKLRGLGWTNQDFLGYYGCDTYATIVAPDEGFDIGSYPTTNANRHNVHFGGPSQHEGSCGSNHDTDTDIRHLGYHFAWFVAQKYGGQCVDLVAHSMGGVIVRYAMSRLGTTDFPAQSQVCIKRIITFASPHNGASAAGAPLTSDQTDQMMPWSDFTKDLQTTAQNPQGAGGTLWTLVGSESDDTVPWESALTMDGAARKIRYDSICSNPFSCTQDLEHGDYFATEHQNVEPKYSWKYEEVASGLHWDVGTGWSPLVLADQSLAFDRWACAAETSVITPFPLQFGQAYTSDVYPTVGDECWYAVSVPSSGGQDLRLVLDGGSASRELHVSPPPGSGLSQCNDTSSNARKECVYANAPSGTYLVWVRYVQSVKAPFELSTSFVNCAAQSNDCFRNAASATASPYSNTQGTAGTGTEPLEAAPSCFTPGSTVWYRFTAPASGTATVTTDTGSTNYDTTLAAYTGGSRLALSQVACNDDINGAANRHSTVSFTCTAGATYYIQAGGFNGAQGTLSLSITGCAPVTPPGAPTGLTANAGNAQAALSWSAPTTGGSVQGYRMYRSTVQSSDGSVINSGDCAATISATRTSCTDTGLTNGVTYYYKVAAFNSGGESRSGQAPATPSAPGTPSFSEDWENGLSGWTVTGAGASQDCSVGQSGCSLKLLSTGSAGVTVSKSMSVTMASPSTASFWFRGSSTIGDTDSSIGVSFNSGSVRLQITEPTLNNGVNLYGPSGNTGVFTTWGSANTWYQAVVTINPTTDTASAQIKDASGAVVGTSGNVAIPAAATTVTGMDFYAVKWNGLDMTFWFDAARVTGSSGGGGGTPAFSEDWENGLSGWSVTGAGASQDCSVGQSGCSLKLLSTGSAGVTVSKSMSVTMASPSTVSFWFRGSATSGDTDSSIGMSFDTGSIRLQITEPSSNNGVNLYGPSGNTGAFTTWGSANTWYQAVVTINPTTDTASAQIKDAAGNVVGTSGNIAIPAAATAVTGMDFYAVKWNGVDLTFWFDAVRVTGSGGGSGFTEGWESGLSGWTTSGTTATQDCSVGQSGCSLKLQSTGSAGVTVSKSMSVAMASPTTASFWFRGSATAGDTDSSIGVSFNSGSVRLQITEPSSNNGVNLYGPNGNTGAFTTWGSANTWYQAVITVNPTTDTASAQIKDAGGNVVGTSGTVAIPAAATTVTGMDFYAVKWNGVDMTFWFDTVSIQ